MARKEFSKSVKVAVIKRATVDGKVFCEECGGLAKKWEIDHVIPDALHVEEKVGSNETSNAKLLCIACHKEKTKSDIATISKAKRREASHLGIRKRPTLTGRGFPKFEKTHKIDKSQFNLPRRNMFKDS